AGDRRLADGGFVEIADRLHLRARELALKRGVTAPDARDERGDFGVLGNFLGGDRRLALAIKPADESNPLQHVFTGIRHEIEPGILLTNLRSDHGRERTGFLEYAKLILRPRRDESMKGSRTGSISPSKLDEKLPDGIGRHSRSWARGALSVATDIVWRSAPIRRTRLPASRGASGDAPSGQAQLSHRLVPASGNILSINPENNRMRARRLGWQLDVQTISVAQDPQRTVVAQQPHRADRPGV